MKSSLIHVHLVICESRNPLTVVLHVISHEDIHCIWFNVFYGFCEWGLSASKHVKSIWDFFFFNTVFLLCYWWYWCWKFDLHGLEVCNPWVFDVIQWSHLYTLLECPFLEAFKTFITILFVAFLWHNFV